MAASQELVIALEEKANVLKEPYMQRLHQLEGTKNSTAKREALQEAHSAGLNYFNAYESMVQNERLRGAHQTTAG